MATPKRVGDLEISQDLGFQRGEWLFERVGWAVMLVIVVATLLGLFGRGWLSAASVGSRSGPVHLEYERLTRLFSPTELTVVLNPQHAGADTASVWLDRSFMQSVEVLDIIPQPADVRTGPDRLTYRFPVATPDTPITVTFQIQPEHPWWHSGRIGLPGGDALPFSQFVFP